MQTIKAQIKFKKNKCFFTIFDKTFELDERNVPVLYKSHTELHKKFSEIDYKCFIEIESEHGTQQTSVINKSSVDDLLVNLMQARRANKWNANKKVILLPNNTKAPTTRT